MAQDFVKDDYFKCDCETHLYPNIEHLNYYPEMQLLQRSAEGIRRIVGLRRAGLPLEAPPGGFPPESTAEALIGLMDKYGVDIACVMREDVTRATGGAAPWSTNGYIAEACEKYPDRLIFEANVGPLLRRGLKNAIWELEYLVRERNCRLVKFVPIGDTYINDRELWPFYAKVADLGIPISIHTGMTWVAPGQSKYCLPMLLEEVASDFPQMPIIAFHAGWPYYHDMNLIAAVNMNVYVSFSLLVPWTITAPRRAAEVFGEALQFVGPDRLLWGTDYFGPGAEVQIRLSVEGFRDFQVPEDMREGYGFPSLSQEDKRKIFGGNMAALLGIAPTRSVKA